MPIILAIESSCDDTSAAICKDGKILSNIITSQSIHQKWGGVVPELASRDHLKNIWLTVNEAFLKANVSKEELSAIAFTRGPGLIGSLLVGISFAKGLALALNIPMIEVNHTQAHVVANFIDQTPCFPHICLTVSGGHTQLVLVKNILEMEIIGQTIDDAAGEAFDKTAKILGLPYPGGPEMDKLAKSGDPKKFTFPIPKSEGEFNFSFSGLKTSVLYFVRDEVKKNEHFVAENLADLCASIQFTIVKSLLKKLEKAVKHFEVKELSLAGGVSANSSLRKGFEELGLRLKCKTYFPKFEYCTDNAGMIAMVAHYKFLQNDFCSHEVEPLARYSI